MCDIFILYAIQNGNFMLVEMFERFRAKSSSQFPKKKKNETEQHQ